MPTADEVLEAINGSIESIAANALRVDAEGRFPDDSLDILADAGAFGLVATPDHGGAGGSLSHLAECCEAVGGACASTGLVFLMHSVATVALQVGRGPAAEAAVKDIVETRALASLAMAEPGGTPFHAPELAALRSEDGAVSVTGVKSFVTSGGQADYYLMPVRSDEGLDLYLLSKEEKGVRWSGSWWGLGMAGSASIDMNLDGVNLIQDRRVGGSGKGADLLMSVVAPWLMAGLSALSVGIAQAAASAATEHVTARIDESGAAPVDIQYLRHLIADMDTATRRARLLVHNAAALADAGDPGAIVAIMEAKVCATETAEEVTGMAMRATGGPGYTPDLPVERHLRDARAGAVIAPTNGVLRDWIGRVLTGRSYP